MSTRNLVVMFGAMAALRRVDQEEPLVLLYSRIAYLAYVVFTTIVYVALHFRVLGARDTTLLTIPLPRKPPSISDTWAKMKEAAEKAEREAEAKANGVATGDGDDEASTTTTGTGTAVATADSADGAGERAEKKDDDNDEDDDEEQKEETVTVMEYDLRHLANARRSWATSTIFLAVVHYHMQSVNPLVMSCVMGLTRLMTDEPLVQIHLRAAPAVDKLARPFAAEKSPFASMLKELAPKDGAGDSAAGDASGSGSGSGSGDAGSGSGSAGGSANRAIAAQAAATEDLHDDGDDDDDDDDEAPVPMADRKDDHIKSDFDDEEDEAAKKEQ